MNSLNIKEIGKRFQSIRKELKLVQSDIAKETGVTVPVIKNLEGGRTKTINMPIINLFCQKYNINIDWILKGIGSPFNKTSILDTLIKQYNFSPLEETMLKNYIKLSDNERKVFTKYFMSLSSVMNQIDANELINNIEKDVNIINTENEMKKFIEETPNTLDDFEKTHIVVTEKNEYVKEFNNKLTENHYKTNESNNNHKEKIIKDLG